MRESATTLAPEISARELAKLTSLLRAEQPAGAHLEIGTAAGGTLRELMRGYADADRPRFVVVDPMTYFPDQLAIVRRNLAAAGLDPDRVDFRIRRSWPAFRAAERAGERFAFIFVDGSHKIHHVTEDLAGTRLLVPGGYVCFHDYTPEFPGVVEAVDRFLAQHPNYAVMGHVERLLVVRKRAPSDRREIGGWDRLRARAIGVFRQLRASLVKRLPHADP